MAEFVDATAQFAFAEYRIRLKIPLESR